MCAPSIRTSLSAPRIRRICVAVTTPLGTSVLIEDPSAVGQKAVDRHTAHQLWALRRSEDGRTVAAWPSGPSRPAADATYRMGDVVDPRLARRRELNSLMSGAFLGGRDRSKHSLSGRQLLKIDSAQPGGGALQVFVRPAPSSRERHAVRLTERSTAATAASWLVAPTASRGGRSPARGYPRTRVRLRPPPRGTHLRPAAGG